MQFWTDDAEQKGLHSPFKLSIDGEVVVLTDVASDVMESVTFQSFRQRKRLRESTMVVMSGKFVQKEHRSIEQLLALFPSRHSTSARFFGDESRLVSSPNYAI